MNFITPTASGDTVKNDIQTQTAQAQQPAVATATATAAAQAEATQAPVSDQGPGYQPPPRPPPTTPPLRQLDAVSIPTLTRPSTYTLQKGEWPICIARRFDLDLASLFSANGLTMDSRPATGPYHEDPLHGQLEHLRLRLARSAHPRRL